MAKDEREELFLLRTTEDGDVYFSTVCVEDLAQYPEDAFFARDDFKEGFCVGAQTVLLLIKGRIVKPTPVEVVTKYEVK